MASAIVAAFHYLALAIGLPAVFLRGRALKQLPDRDAFIRLFIADSAWGLAAVLWIVTGTARAFGALEKGTAYYMQSRLFWVKMALFITVFVLEIGPMLTFLRWRKSVKNHQTIDLTPVPGLLFVNHAEVAIVVLIVFVASFMARGF
jgi:putative membrane protein